MTPWVGIVLFEFTSTADGYEPMYREDVVLVMADNEEAARTLIATRADAECAPATNEAGEQIDMRVLAVIDVTPALDDDLTQGGDVYARHFHDIEAYRRFETLARDIRPAPHNESR